MSQLTEYLERFNRKERFFLIGLALGNSHFRLGTEFRVQIGQAVGLTVPEDAFVAMDYHLDWLYASLYLGVNGGRKGPHSNTDKIIHAQQEDMDLIVAFRERDLDHVILLEAKGATGWTNKQMASKAKRLREIFGPTGGTFPGVVPHFIIASPRRTEGLIVKDWPTWMAPDGIIPWMKMGMPTDLWRVTRCTKDEVSSQGGNHWMVVDA